MGKYKEQINNSTRKQQKMDRDVLSNEEYRERLRNIFDKIEDNRKLRFWYTYISRIEEG